MDYENILYQPNSPKEGSHTIVNTLNNRRVIIVKNFLEKLSHDEMQEINEMLQFVQRKEFINIRPKMREAISKALDLGAQQKKRKRASFADQDEYDPDKHLATWVLRSLADLEFKPSRQEEVAFLSVESPILLVSDARASPSDRKGFFDPAIHCTMQSLIRISTENHRGCKWLLMSLPYLWNYQYLTEIGNKDRISKLVFDRKVCSNTPLSRFLDIDFRNYGRFPVKSLFTGAHSLEGWDSEFLADSTQRNKNKPATVFELVVPDADPSMDSTQKDSTTSTSSISRGDEDINQPWPKTCKCGNDGLLNMLCSNYSEDSMEYRLIADADSLSPDQSDQDEEQSIATPLLNSLNSTSSFKASNGSTAQTFSVLSTSPASTLSASTVAVQEKAAKTFSLSSFRSRDNRLTNLSISLRTDSAEYGVFTKSMGVMIKIPVPQINLTAGGHATSTRNSASSPGAEKVTGTFANLCEWIEEWEDTRPLQARSDVNIKSLQRLPAIIHEVLISPGKVDLVVQVYLDYRWLNQRLIELSECDLVSTNIFLQISSEDVVSTFVISPPGLYSESVKARDADSVRDCESKSATEPEMIVKGHIEFSKFEGQVLRGGTIQTPGESTFVSLASLIDKDVWDNADKIKFLLAFAMLDEHVPGKAQFLRSVPATAFECLSVISWRVKSEIFPCSTLERRRVELANDIEIFARSKVSLKTRKNKSWKTNTFRPWASGRVLMALVETFTRAEARSVTLQDGNLTVILKDTGELKNLFPNFQGSLCQVDADDPSGEKGKCLKFDFTCVDRSSGEEGANVFLYPPVVFRYLLFNTKDPDCFGIGDFPAEGRATVSFSGCYVSSVGDLYAHTDLPRRNEFLADLAKRASINAHA